MVSSPFFFSVSRQRFGNTIIILALSTTSLIDSLFFYPFATGCNFLAFLFIFFVDVSELTRRTGEFSLHGGIVVDRV